ncbi:family 2 encapsulin nanocompartment cargo protein terpene cyclase [Nocardia sp. NPDC046473]|uniref:family 2 encapsulin nanocompartment cargo protein terpene cyclase n=1 Tax=Nocardia sp. NPDC046473 TaxID=3155733 RepID=UPI0033E6B10C
MLTAPTGVGTAAARAPGLPTPAPPYLERQWGDGSAPPLYCPAPERNDVALAAEVEQRLAAWALDVGFSPDEIDHLRAVGFGSLMMLTHSQSNDPDLLLLAAQLNTGWWAADDYYADDTALGAVPELLSPRLALAMAAMDPLPPAGEFTPPLERALQSDLVLRTLGSAVDHLHRHATPAQIQRVCYSTFSMFVAWTAYATWRHTGDLPTAWEYLGARQHDSFYTSMTLIDVVGGYELPANLFYEPRVRRAAIRAGTAAVLVNDLMSVAKDAADEVPVCNMVLLIAAERNCSIERATEITVDLHNRIVRDFRAGHDELRAVPSPELQLFLHGLQAWLGGGFEWHNTNPRYH